MQWNACGLLAHSIQLKNYLSTVKTLPHIICIQESFLKPKHNYKLDNYKIIRRDRLTENKGGVVTMIRSDFSFKTLNNPVETECLIVEVMVNKKLFKIANVYNRPNSDINVNEYCNILADTCTVMTGDLNGHSPLWGGDHLDKTGRILENIIEETNCVVINSGQGTYQKVGGGMSVLDLSIVSNDLALKSNWSYFKFHTGF